MPLSSVSAAPFALANSRSMADNQADLLAHYDAFVAGFVETIEQLASACPQG